MDDNSKGIWRKPMTLRNWRSATNRPEPDPAFDVIAIAPALDAAANCLHNRERRLDYIGAAQGPAKLVRHAQLVNRQGSSMPSSRLRAALGFRSIQLPMQLIERAFGLGIAGHRIRVLQFAPHVGFVFIGQMIDNVAALVDLAALDQSASPACLRTAEASALPPSQDVQPRHREVHAAFDQFAHSELTTAVFSVAPSRMPSTVFAPSQPIPRAAIICRSLNGVPSMTMAQQPQLAQRTLHQLLHLFAAGLDEVLAPPPISPRRRRCETPSPPRRS